MPSELDEARRARDWALEQLWREGVCDAAEHAWRLQHSSFYAKAVALVEALATDYSVWDLTSAVVAAQEELETELRQLGWRAPSEEAPCQKP